MQDNKHTIIEKLRTEKNYVRRYLIATLVMVSLITVSLPIAALALADTIWPVRERAAFLLILGGLTLSIAFLAIRIRRWRSLFPSERKIALLIEKSYPELMDSLICSLELLDGKRRAPNSLSQALIGTVADDLAKRQIREVVKKETTNWYKMTALIALTIVAVVSASRAPVTDKAITYSRTFLTGHSNGLNVRPGDTEIAEGDDITILTDVVRGPTEARIMLTDEKGEFSYNMYEKSGGKSSFDIFGVDRDFSYFVTTARLKSRTYHVRVYEKPAIVTASIRIQPPEYTRLPATELNEIKDFSVPAGSRVRFSVETNMPVTATMKTDIDRDIPFQSLDGQRYETDLIVTEGFKFAVALRDSQGHMSEANRYFQLECIQDFAPLIQRIAPEDDEKTESDAEVSYSYRVSDDYGVTSIKMYYAVNGDDRRMVPLFSLDGKPAATEEVAAYRLSLAGAVEDGDVVSYYCSAADNAVPEPNVSITEVGFIEIRPEKSEADEGQQGGHGGEKKTLKVSDLIVEQKHLIRSSWNRLNSGDRPRGNEGFDELNRSAADLHYAAKTRLADLVGAPVEEEIESITPQEPPTALDGMVGELFRDAIANADPLERGIASLGKVGELFESSIANMARTVEFLQKSLTEESLMFQHGALSDLVSLEIELEKNTPPPSSQGGEGEPSESQEAEEKSQQKKEQEKALLLDKLLARINRLIHSQSGVNDVISRELENMDKETAAYIEEREKEIHRKTSEVRRELSGLQEAYAGVLELDNAVREMRSLIRALRGGESENSLKHGQFASQFLERTKELIEGLQRGLAQGRLANLSKALEDITNAEASLTNETLKKIGGAPNSMDAGELTKTQKEIREKLDELLKNMGSAADDLDESNPGAARELANAREAAGKANISGKMKRAENSSRYGRLDRAADYQKEVNESLAALSQGVNRAMQHRPSLSSEELGRMLQSVAQHAQELEAAKTGSSPGGNRESLYRSIDENLKDITEKMNVEQMDQIANAMTQMLMGTSETSGAGDAEIMALLHRTAGVLESRLMLNALERKLSLSRVTGQQAPDEFKKLVNAYFKRLSRSQ